MTLEEALDEASKTDSATINDGWHLDWLVRHDLLSVYPDIFMYLMRKLGYWTD